MNNFAKWLKAMLDNTRLFTRAEWAKFLEVPEGTLEGWVNGLYNPPPPEKLRSIVQVLLESDGVKGARELLTEVETLPLAHISNGTPATWKNASTLAEYLCLPLVNGLRRSMAGLTMKQQEKILFDAAEAARKIKGVT